ncbi:vicilin-like seed storage protein At2g18540 [Acanthaster planci]|uniref:Vicilin-like seed storage protein At2g18540 n=1 Tax=Acanthaster planci TaxID=133434 RepID=A0A8B7ZNK0_ACAPL|nr:vicilin-like seed storage protein At2g18540 [Acanthaster planci]
MARGLEKGGERTKGEKGKGKAPAAKTRDTAFLYEDEKLKMRAAIRASMKEAGIGMSKVYRVVAETSSSDEEEFLDRHVADAMAMSPCMAAMMEGEQTGEEAEEETRGDERRQERRQERKQERRQGRRKGERRQKTGRSLEERRREEEIMKAGEETTADETEAAGPSRGKKKEKRRRRRKR